MAKRSKYIPPADDRISTFNRGASAQAFPYEIMLDSGAYSAWFHGAPLDLDLYIAYCQEHRELFSSIVCLDQIPGSQRQAARSFNDIETAAKQSFDNFMRMRRAGIETIPVFHQGEPWYWLERYMKEGVGYIGISPYPRASQENILAWLDQVFTFITDEAGEPLIKTHGFGATSWGMITRYPWFSIDSTTWALAAGYATLIVPPHLKIAGEWMPNYGEPPYRFSLTDRDSAGSRPYLLQGPMVRKMIDDYAEAAGLSLGELRASDRCRAQLNAFYYKKLEESLSCQPFRFRQRTASSLGKRLVRFNFRPRVIFAEQVGKHEYGRALERVGARSRLISYYESRKLPADALAVYCRTGLLEKGLLAPKKRGSQSWIVNRSLGLLKRLRMTEYD